MSAPARARLCESCERERPVLRRPKNGARLCKSCFFAVFEAEVHETIVREGLFRRGERVAIGASGGKDSTVLAYLLRELNARHDYGLQLLLLSIDEGITGYRDDSLETVKRNAVDYGLPLHILSYKDLYGWSMDDIVGEIGLRGNCTFCGVFRRQALDRGAAALGVDRVVTGHNADDMAETVLMNLLRGDIARLGRCAAAVTGAGSSMPRCKPFKFCYEKEIVLYAYHRDLVYFSTECIYSPNAYRGFAREFIKDIEAIRPSAILDIVHSAEAWAVPAAAAAAAGESGGGAGDAAAAGAGVAALARVGSHAGDAAAGSRGAKASASDGGSARARSAASSSRCGGACSCDSRRVEAGPASPCVGAGSAGSSEPGACGAAPALERSARDGRRGGGDDGSCQSSGRRVDAAASSAGTSSSAAIASGAAAAAAGHSPRCQRAPCACRSAAAAEDTALSTPALSHAAAAAHASATPALLPPPARRRRRVAARAQGECIRCGYMTSNPGGLCQACNLLSGLEAGRPRIALGAAGVPADFATPVLTHATAGAAAPAW